MNRHTGWIIITFLAIFKIAIHFFTLDNFELHRDAYLYYAKSEHLAWGFIAVPPSMAFFGKIATFFFGNTVFALRFFPAIVGALCIVIIGKFVKDLGGKRIAISLACLAFLLSPAYLHTNALFQPVSFNQFYWLLSGYLIFKLINENNPRYWLWIGLVFGLSFLNKYSVLFMYVPIALSLLISRYRSLYWSKYFLMAVILAGMIIAPNIIWQYQNSWPVIHHMSELRATQLVHVRYVDFVVAQFLMNAHALLIWLFALFILLFNEKGKQYRIFGHIYVLIIVLLMAGSGKAYYTLGIYPILFVFGSYFIEKYSGKYLKYWCALLVLWMLTGLYFSLSLDGVPLSTADAVRKDNAFRWEDGINHDIPQDMADMTGWKEIGETVSEIYLGLGSEHKDNCDIYCYHYGQAGAVMFYGKKHNIPQPIAPNASFIFWSPDSLSKDYMIYVHSDLGNDVDPESRLPQLFEKVSLVKTIDNPDFRENGTKIYLCESPNDYCKTYYKSMIRELKDEYR